METTLDVRGVTRRYGTREVLKGITFAAQKGEIIALLGRNGTGKSTLMNTITGVSVPVRRRHLHLRL